MVGADVQLGHRRRRHEGKCEHQGHRLLYCIESHGCTCVSLIAGESPSGFTCQSHADERCRGLLTSVVSLAIKERPWAIQLHVTELRNAQSMVESY
jgi:hypothetical protein